MLEGVGLGWIGNPCSWSDVGWQGCILGMIRVLPSLPGLGLFVEGVVGVDHPFPDGFSGKLGVCVGECFHWTLLAEFLGCIYGSQCSTP